MGYSFRLLFAFVSMCRSRRAHFFLQFFISAAHVCTYTQHDYDDTFQQEEYQSTSRLEIADEKIPTKGTEKIPTRGTVCTRGTDTFSVLGHRFCLTL